MDPTIVISHVGPLDMAPHFYKIFNDKSDEARIWTPIGSNHARCKMYGVQGRLRRRCSTFVLAKRPPCLVRRSKTGHVCTAELSTMRALQ